MNKELIKKHRLSLMRTLRNNNHNPADVMYRIGSGWHVDKDGAEYYMGRTLSEAERNIESGNLKRI